MNVLIGRLISLLFISLYVCFLAGCAALPDGHVLPARLDTAPLAQGGWQVGTPAGHWPDEHWWQALGDAQLNTLIDEALHNSPRLITTRARVERARELAGQVESRHGPRLTFNAEAQHAHFQENYLYPPGLAGTEGETGRLSFDGLWELDFFGVHADELAAALSRSRAGVYEQRASVLALATLIVRTYTQLDRDWALEANLDVQIAQRTHLLTLIEKRVAVGLDAPAQTKELHAGIKDAEREHAAVQERRRILQTQLAALVGAGPERGTRISRPALNMALERFAPPADLPVELLARRADVAAQIERIEAAFKDVHQARQRFYPNINLVGFVGPQVIGLGNLLHNASVGYGVGPALSLPIFDSGRLRANLRISEIDLDEAIGQYNALLVDAMRDVASVVTSQQGIARQIHAQNAAEQDLDDAVRLSRLRRQSGLGDEIAVLKVLDRQLALQRSGIELRSRQRQAWIDLHHTLGAGFTAVPSAAEARS